MSGTNQHTWRVNNINPQQTFKSEESEGIRWNSGFRPSNNPVEPSLGKEYSLSIPFLLSSDKGTGGFMIFNPAPNVPSYEDAYYGISRFDLPVSYFWHVEYSILSDEGRKDLEYKAGFLERLRNSNDYNFMTESQMAKSFYSVMKSNVGITMNPFKNLIYSIENRLRTKKQFEIILRDVFEGDAKFAGEYSKVTGVKFEPGEKYKGLVFGTDSNVYMRKGSDLYFGVNEDAKVYIDYGDEKTHIVRVNSPYKIRKGKEGLEIEILGTGLQQLKIFAPGGADFDGDEWDAVKDGDYYTLTRYGGATVLTVK